MRRCKKSYKVTKYYATAVKSEGSMTVSLCEGRISAALPVQLSRYRSGEKGEGLSVIKAHIVLGKNFRSEQIT